MTEPSKADPSFFAPVVVCVGLGFFLWYRDPTAVPLLDLMFAFGYPLYIWLANTICFQSNQLPIHASKTKEKLSLGKGQFLGKPAFTAYMVFFQVATVLLPLLWIFFAPSKNGIPSSSSKRAAVTPLVLLLVQVAMENSTLSFHDVPRVLIPIGFNAFRLRSLLTWFLASYYNEVSQLEHSSELVHDVHSSWEFYGLVLALLNLILWTYNLFIFLLLRVLPVYFDKKETPPIEMAYTLVPIPLRKTKDCHE